MTIKLIFDSFDESMCYCRIDTRRHTMAWFPIDGILSLLEYLHYESPDVHDCPFPLDRYTDNNILSELADQLGRNSSNPELSVIGSFKTVKDYHEYLRKLAVAEELNR